MTLATFYKPDTRHARTSGGQTMWPSVGATHVLERKQTENTPQWPCSGGAVGGCALQGQIPCWETSFMHGCETQTWKFTSSLHGQVSSPHLGCRALWCMGNCKQRHQQQATCM